MRARNLFGIVAGLEEQKRALARELTDAYVRVTGIRPEAVWVTIDELPAENWAIGGTLVADRN